MGLPKVLPPEWLSLPTIEAEQARRDLGRFIPFVSQRYQRPNHLNPYLDRLRRIANGEVQRLVVHTPPRHGKTESLLHFIPWYLQKHPTKTVSYSSYSADITRSKSRIAIQLAKDAGLQLESENITEWRLKTRGGCLAKGIGEGLTGQGVDVALVDDPVKDRLQAESKTYRERTKDWFRDVLMTRIEPGGSVVVNMTRWHPDDLAGFCISELGFEYLCLPALNDDGKALWPERWGTTDLAARRKDVGEYTWASLYQGQPRPRGGSVFGDVNTFSDLPTDGLRYAVGIDLAYSKKTSSDYSVAVVMARREDRYFITEVVRKQLRAPEFLEHLKAIKNRQPRARFHWIASGTESGVADFFNLGGKDAKLNVEVTSARGDKFTRAVDYAAAWNRGEILLPEFSATEDINELAKEHASFTGVDDDNDDTVDAAVAAFEVLRVGQGASGLGTVGSRRY